MIEINVKKQSLGDNDGAIVDELGDGAIDSIKLGDIDGVIDG